MRFLVLVFFVLCLAIAVQASPARKKQPKCDIVCTADYTPVCGGVPNDKTVKPRLFANECVMETHNCENKSHLVKVDMDKCKGSGGVRLS